MADDLIDNLPREKWQALNDEYGVALAKDAKAGRLSGDTIAAAAQLEKTPADAAADFAQLQSLIERANDLAGNPKSKLNDRIAKMQKQLDAAEQEVGRAEQELRSATIARTKVQEVLRGAKTDLRFREITAVGLTRALHSHVPAALKAAGIDAEKVINT